jgi:glycosyltransferase involved in cell wall biosynthesis
LRNVKILFIAPVSPPVTGQSLAAERLLQKLKKDHSVQCIDFSKGTFKQGLSSVSRVVQVSRILRQIHAKQKSADAIYLTPSQSVAGNIKDLVTYTICFKKLGRMVLHLHGGGIKRIVFDRHPILRWINRVFLERVGGAIVLSPSLREIFAGMVPDEKIHTIANFAQDEFFLDTEQIQSKFATTEPLRLLFLSNLIKGKGFNELANAYDLLSLTSRNKVQIDFAGEFGSKREKRSFLANIRGKPAVRYHEVVQGDKKRRLLAEAHILCLPTYYAYYEGQPIAILEGYASGCAVITTNHGGIPDIFEAGRTGFYVEKQSARSIADAVERLLRKPKDLERIAVYNNSLARTLYTESRCLSSLAEVIKEVLK